MQYRRFLIGAGLLVLGLISASAGWAQDASNNAPCAQDIKTLCPNVRGVKNINKCLREHEAQVSQACKTHRAAFREKVRLMHEACKADVQNYCNSAKPGRRAVFQCLQNNVANLSPDCKKFVEVNTSEPST